MPNLLWIVWVAMAVLAVPARSLSGESSSHQEVPVSSDEWLTSMTMEQVDEMQWNFAMLASYATGNAGPVASWRSENVHEILGVKFEALAAIIVLDDPIARLEMASADYRRLLLIPARSALPKRP